MPSPEQGKHEGRRTQLACYHRQNLKKLGQAEWKENFRNLFQAVLSSLLWYSFSWEAKDADWLMHWKLYCRQEFCRNWDRLECKIMDWMS